MEKIYAQRYALLEDEHWWFRARRMILRDLLAQLEWPQHPTILEIGVGPGHNLLEVYPPDARLEGIEPDDGLARLAARRGPAQVFHAAIGSHRKSRTDVMMALQCLTCSNILKMTHGRSRS